MAATVENSAKETEVPEFYAEQLAAKIIELHEDEIDPAISSENIARLIYDTTKDPELIEYFINAIDFLLEDMDSSKFAAIAWAALVMQSDVFKEYVDYINRVIIHVLTSYYNMDKPEIDFRGSKFSAQSYMFGTIFVQMIEINAALYETIQEIYTTAIRREIEMENKASERKGKPQAFLKKVPQKQAVSKKFYDDVIDYLHTRGIFKPTSLNQDNPNEHIANLADRMRGTRRYTIQDIMNKRALERKKRLQRELSERLASAEELLLATTPFRNGLALFWREKRYNYKFLAVEKIRVALQIIGVIMGVGYFMAGYLQIWGLGNIEGGLVCLGMWGFSKFAGSRKNFKLFYPDDVSKELEINVANFANVMRRLSREQLDQFLVRQVKAKENEAVLQLIPEYIKYLYAVMPDRKDMILTVDELSTLLENIEVDIAKQLRSLF